MRKQKGAAEGSGDAATVAGKNGQAFPQVCRVTMVPSNAVVQETADGVDVVVTAPGKGTFLIRKRVGSHPGSRCPLLNYEIRRLDEAVPRQEGSSRATPRIGSAFKGTGRQAAPAAMVMDTPRQPHWRLALQLAADPLLKSAPRGAE